MGYKFNRRKINYIVKPEEGVVAGWINVVAYATGVAEEMKNGGDLLWATRLIDKENVIIRAVSRCREDDVFDEKVGKKIVADILEKKYHIVMSKAYKKLYKELEKSTWDCLNNYLIHNERTKELQERLNAY